MEINGEVSEGDVRMIQSLDEALSRASQLLANPRQVHRIVMSGRRRTFTPQFERIDIRPVEIKAVLHFQLVSHDGKRDVTKNVVPTELSLLALMSEGYGNLLVETTSEELSIRVTKSGDAQVSHKRKTAPDATEELRTSLAHDRKKSRYLDEDELVFQALGISDHNGKLKPSRTDKFIQVNEFLKIINGLLLLPDQNIAMVDLGCGNAYLTFAAHQFLKTKGINSHTTGVDSRTDSRERNNTIAKEVGIEGEIEFVAEEISSFPEQKVDITLALHACDTASDDALAWAIRSKSEIILVAPCCHHDIQRQIKSVKRAPDSWSITTRHGILRERIGDILTDSIRAQILRILGYETDVIEFIDSEHTPKNLMIRAIYKGGQASQSDFAELDAMIESWQVQPRLMTLLAEAISSRRSNALS